MKIKKCCILAVVTFWAIACAQAASYDLTPASPLFPSLLGNLQPGDVVTFRSSTPDGGTFWFDPSQHLSFAWNGTLAQPIIIQGAPGENIILSPTFSASTFFEASGSYFIFRNFEIDGFTYPNQIRLLNGTSHAIFENNYFHDFNSNPLSANQGTAHFRNLTFRGNRFEKLGGTGECLNLGGAGGYPKVYESLVENNTCANTCYYTHPCVGGSLGAGFQFQSGSHSNTIRDNVCYQTYKACVLLYDDYDRGTSLIEGNVITDTVAGNSIQVIAGAVIRNNLIQSYAGTYAAISVSAASVSSNRNVHILHNTIYRPYYGIYFSSSTTSLSKNLTVVNNLILNAPAGSDIVLASNNWSSLERVQNNGVNSPGGTPLAAPAQAFVRVGTTAEEVINFNNYNYNLYSTSISRKAGTPNPLAYDINGFERDGCTPSLGAYEYNPNPYPLEIYPNLKFKKRAGPIPSCDLNTTCATTIECTPPTSTPISSPTSSPVSNSPPNYPMVPLTSTPISSPTGTPSSAPIGAPLDVPTGTPNAAPSSAPTTVPTTNDPTSDIPTGTPDTAVPSSNPSTVPTGSPSSTSPVSQPFDSAPTNEGSSVLLLSASLYILTLLIAISLI